MLPAISCAFFFSPPFHAQSGTPEKETSKNRISISIATKQATLKVGDPTVLNILLKNTSEYKYYENHVLETGHAEWNDYNIEVKDAGGTMTPLVSKPILPLRQRPELSGSRAILCLAPGEVRKESISVDQIVDMSRAGTYYVQVIHRDRGTDTDFVSNIIQIEFIYGSFVQRRELLLQQPFAINLVAIHK